MTHSLTWFNEFFIFAVVTLYLYNVTISAKMKLL